MSGRHASADAVATGPLPLAVPAPVRFVHNGRDGWEEAVAAPDLAALLARDARVREMFGANGDLCWTVQTFCRLREAGFGGIELARAPAPGRINCAKAKTWTRRGADRRVFAVSIQADYPRVLWAQTAIQQNADQMRRDDTLVHLWPQAGIVPRAAERRGLARVAYMGQVDGNLAAGPDAWRALVERRGLAFAVPPPDAWHDFSAFDAVVAVRSLDRRHHSRKPPSKLVNAWLAGVPLIGGWDSAFSQIGRPGVDYLRVASLDEAGAALDRLLGDPSSYAALVAAGRARAKRHGDAAVLAQWVAALEGPIAARYRRWAASRGAERAGLMLRAGAQEMLDAAKAAARRFVGRGFEV